MNRLLLLLPLVLLTTVPHAAAPKNRVGFVDVPQLLSSVAGSADYLTLRKNIDADLTKREKALQTLATKANQTRSAADRNAFAKAQQVLFVGLKTVVLPPLTDPNLLLALVDGWQLGTKPSD